MLKYRADYRPPACKVISAGLDISIHDDRTFVTTTLELDYRKSHDGEQANPSNSKGALRDAKIDSPLQEFRI